jgi:pilus assembly protein Flp/PilA
MSHSDDRLPRKIREFVRDTSGVTAIEYGLIAAGISLAIVVTVSLFGDELGALFGDLSDAIANR